MDIDLILDPPVLVALGAILGVVGQVALKALEARYQAVRGTREDAAKAVTQQQVAEDRADERELSSIKAAAEMLKDWASKLLIAYDVERARREVSDALVINLRQEIVALRWQVTELTHQLTQATGIVIRPMPEIVAVAEPSCVSAEPTMSVEAKRDQEVGPKPDVSALVDVIVGGNNKKT